MYLYPHLFILHLNILNLNINLSCLSVPVAPSMPRKWTVWTVVTPTLVSGEITWFYAAVLPHPPCVPHPPILAPSAAPRLRRWLRHQTAATVMTQRSRVLNRCHFVQSDFRLLKQCSEKNMIKTQELLRIKAWVIRAFHISVLTCFFCLWK